MRTRGPIIPTNSNESTLQAAKAGNRAALSDLVRHWHRPLRAFVGAVSLSPQDADDIAQEVFLRALDRLDRVESIDAIGPFLKGIARNVIRERQRKYARESQAYIRLVEDRCGKSAESDKEAWMTDPDVLTALRSCLSNLPEQAKQMLAMRYADEQTSDQIGQSIGMKADAVRTAMRRARITLLKCIQSTYGSVVES